MRPCDHEKLQILGFVIVALAFSRLSPVVADKRAVLELDALDCLWRPAQIAASFDNAGDGCREGTARGCSAEHPYGMKRVACRKGA